MEIKCPNCLEVFTPEKTDEQKVSDAIKRGQTLFIVECTKCYKDVPINPCNLLNIIVPIKNDNEIIYCPICKDGIISFVKDKDEGFYGCGECGNVWKDINEIKNYTK